MSLVIYVFALSGYKANERPLRFELDDQTYEIEAVEEQWRSPDGTYFRVRTTEGERYLLRYDEHEDEWTLQTGFDGDQLLARPGIELVTVDPAAIREAESRIAGCERCRQQADLPFDWIVADALDKHGMYDFVLTEPARCPNCGAEVSEKTLVEPQGGIELEAEV
jgi:hypothetical protein